MATKRTAVVAASNPSPGTLPAPMTPMGLLELATRQGADIDKLKQLMDLQERWEGNEAKKAYVDAMARFKKDPPTIIKNKKASFGAGRTTYEYATLDNVCEKIIASLSAVGISHEWKLEQEGVDIKVTCVLTHARGHSERTWLRATPDMSGSKNNIQAIGSTVSYLERYTLLAATGLAVTGMDDDAIAAAAAQSPQREPDPAFLKTCEDAANKGSEALKQAWQAGTREQRVSCADVLDNLKKTAKHSDEAAAAIP
jgi:hypothetical protein